VRVLFAGTPATSLPSLELLLASRHEVVAVLTRPAARTGRGRRVSPSVVAERAAAAGLEVLTPPRPSDPGFQERLVELGPDCCPIVAYGGLIPAGALSVPRHGWVNLHFSLLPAWRGAAPVQRSLWAGDEVTGATTFRLDDGLDTGPVFGTVTELIRGDDTGGSLLERLARSGADLLLRTLDGIDDGELHPVTQAADGVSLAAKIGVGEARIDWSHPALALDRQVRACTPRPGAWTTVRGERVKLGPFAPSRPSELVADAATLAPGELVVAGQAVTVGTGSYPVTLSDVQPQGRRLMAAADWARGLRLAPGERFG
jgi:methionyl-tRNA formyltransferase